MTRYKRVGMIRKVILRRFKRFQEETFPLPGHIVFAGPNNTGKTTVLQAIALAAAVTYVPARFRAPRWVSVAASLTVAAVVAGNAVLGSRLQDWARNGWTGHDAIEIEMKSNLKTIAQQLTQMRRKGVPADGPESQRAAPPFELPVGSLPNLEVAARANARRPRLNEIKGIVPSLLDLPGGCSFAPRCRFATEQCRAAYPPLEQHRPGHWVACWHAERLLGEVA